MWAYDEIQQVLGEERAGVFCEVYGVKPGGNCTLSARSDPHKEFGGKNVLAEVSGTASAKAAHLLAGGTPSAQVLQALADYPTVQGILCCVLPSNPGLACDPTQRHVQAPHKLCSHLLIHALSLSCNTSGFQMHIYPPPPLLQTARAANTKHSSFTTPTHLTS